MGNIGARIREVRKAHGLTGLYVLEHLGKKGAWLSRREHGTSVVSVEDLISIANVMGVSLHALLD